jgi:hypothetical protein
MSSDLALRECGLFDFNPRNAKQNGENSSEYFNMIRAPSSRGRFSQKLSMPGNRLFWKRATNNRPCFGRLPAPNGAVVGGQAVSGSQKYQTDIHAV